MLKVDHDLTSVGFNSFDSKQFELLYNQLYSSLQQYAVYYVHDEEAAKSIINDLFVQLWFKPQEIQNIKGYLYRSVKNACLNYLSQHQKNPISYVEQDDLTELSDLMTVQEDDDSETAHLVFLKHTISLLPQKRQLVFKMHRLAGFSYAEIADLMQISPRTVEDHLAKAMQFIHTRAKHFLYTNLTEA
ncbi:RNA polymerase sigma-70 factor [Pedobacter sp. Hv1]|uniref:RNA polymerase sigma-70 factor n=1 Tax=Pedobacter sp. Hv1 TaxID=1740090 RepID=UPI0006D893BC|nr:RNA polymerase sigma-70 factor [Pedobacter sp. Hv1]KQC01642.1 hypothetical protein AQF98_04505 [Pedobacter sp. Hv1]